MSCTEPIWTSPKGATTAHIRIDLGGGAVVTASITDGAVDEMKLKKGEKA
jgi:molybdopterin-binding protein